MGRVAKGKRKVGRKTWLLMAMLFPVVCWILVVSGLNLWSSRYIFDRPTRIPSAPVGVVFGAGLLKNGQPSWILRERLDGAIDLYRKGKVTRLLFSGDNRRSDYNEPKAMRAYAIKHSVSPTHIEMDYGGRDTYDTCYRAKNLFGVDRAIFVTQLYHAPRAVFLGRSLGIDSVAYGVPNLSARPMTQLSFSCRELCADLKAIWDVSVSHRKPYVAVGNPRHDTLVAKRFKG